MSRPVVYAATIILTRHEAGELQVFMIRRNRKIAFLGGAYVFPGGKLDAEDVALATKYRRAGDRDLVSFCPEHPEGLWAALQVAALRELYEEAGVLLSKTPSSHEPADRGPERFEALAKAGDLDVDALVYAAHWVTPSREGRRYDTHFFVAELPEGQRASHDGSESIEGAWMSPAAALEAHAQKKLYLPPPTQRELELLQEGLASVREREVGPVLPKLVENEAGVEVLLPWDPSYAECDGEGHPGKPRNAREAGLPSRQQVPRALFKAY